jgi:hypothetical protein
MMTIGIRFSTIAMAVSVLMLSACGGGDQAQSADSVSAKAAAKMSQPTTTQKPLVPDRTVPADAHIKGMFSKLIDLEVMPIHASLLPDGRVFYFGSTRQTSQRPAEQGAHQTFAVWNPGEGIGRGHQVFDNTTSIDMFCTAFSTLFDGSRVMMFGGDTRSPDVNQGISEVTEFTPSNNQVTRSNVLMQKKRWYATAITLPSGDIYVQGGIGAGGDAASDGQFYPEVAFKNANGTQGMRLLENAPTGNLGWFYPRNFVSPNGLVFGYDDSGNMYEVDARGKGAIKTLGKLPNTVSTGTSTTAAMFQPGRILQFGGPVDTKAVVIDIRGGKPQVQETGQLKHTRLLSTATILPNGHVLATGGSQVNNEMQGVAYEAEIWNPTTGQWSIGAATSRSRLYHSTALLLPDATVMVAGGGLPSPEVNVNKEIYFPPYLFTAGGKLAARPTITRAPTVMDLSRTYHVNVNSSKRVARMVMVRHGTVSHSFNSDQRFLELSFAAAATPGAFTVHAPRSAADAPPGMYMLFALDDAGVPSVAAMVRLNPADTAPPPVAKGLRGEYFNNLTLSGPAVTTRTEVVNFDWGSEAPGAFVTADRFSVRWTGTATAPRAGNYVFETRADDGVRLWIDDRLVIDRWLDREATLNASPAITLRANQKVKIRMEYYDNEGYASAQLRWRLPGASAGTVIPSERLSPP